MSESRQRVRAFAPRGVRSIAESDEYGNVESWTLHQSSGLIDIPVPSLKWGLGYRAINALDPVSPRQGFAKLPSAFIHGPGEVYDSEGFLLHEFTHSFSLKEEYFWRERIRIAEGCKGKMKHLEGNTLVLASRFGEIFYHFLFDVMARSRLVDWSEVDHVYVNLEKDFQSQYLDIVGVPKEKRIAANEDTVYACDRILLPTLSSGRDTPSKWACETLKAIADRVSNASSEGPEQIFVSRKDATWRVAANQAEIETEAEKLGFSVVELRGMSVRDQIRLFQNAQIIAGLHGSGLANAVYAPKGCCMVEVFTPKYVNYCFGALAHGCGHKHVSILGNGRPAWRSHRSNPSLVFSNIEVDTKRAVAALEQSLSYQEAKHD